MIPRTLVAALLALVPTVVMAQDSDVWTADRVLDPMQLENTFAIGAGALGFMEQGFDLLDAAMPTWTIRYGWNPDPALTWEWSYAGVTDAFANPAAVNLVGTIFETGFKLNMGPETPAYPIVGVGIGYMAFDGRKGMTDFDMLTVPVLAGFEIQADALVVDFRGTWRPTFFDDDLRFTSLGADSWTLTADLGTRF